MFDKIKKNKANVISWLLVIFFIILAIYIIVITTSTPTDVVDEIVPVYSNQKTQAGQLVDINKIVPDSSNESLQEELFDDIDEKEFKDFDNSIIGITFNDVLNSDEYIGEVITWQGKIKSHGIVDGRFWVIDEEQRNNEIGDWFWASPPSEQLTTRNNWINEWLGSGDFNGDTIFTITGTVLENDCGYYVDICVPNIEVISISKTE